LLSFAALHADVTSFRLGPNAALMVLRFEQQLAGLA
jgi:hypothetical protein